MPQWKQYSGIWTPTQQAQAIAAGTWTGILQPELYAWGENSQGQAGIGDVIDISSPVQVGSLLDWSNVAAGEEFGGAIKTDGTLWTWGDNSYGRLGNNTASVSTSSPVQIGSLTNWSSLSLGRDHGLAIKTNGTLWSWGRAASYGEPGLNNRINQSSPVQVGSLTTWAKIAASRTTSAAIKTDGTLWTWGYNYAGKLGHNNLIDRSSPTQVGALTNWLEVSASEYLTLATKTDGTVWSWGSNSSGALGGGSTLPAYRSSPVQVGALTDWSIPKAGSNAAVVLKTDGTMWSWGASSISGKSPSINNSSPVQIGSDTDWNKTTAGLTHAGAIKTSGILWVWGDNAEGKLGNNATAFEAEPIQIGSLKWGEISFGNNNSIGITAETT